MCHCSVVVAFWSGSSILNMKTNDSLFGQYESCVNNKSRTCHHLYLESSVAVP